MNLKYTPDKEQRLPNNIIDSAEEISFQDP